jgi:putative transposase
VVYRFILDNHRVFGLRWLLRRFNLSPNSYYNFLKCRKSGYYVQKQQVLDTIQKIYHETEGKLGHRSMKIFLSRKNIFLSKTTVHKYMNKELRLTSIVKRKKPGYVKGHTHKVFLNLLNQNFTTVNVNRIWCTDFTYLFLSDGRKCYNCSIIDLWDRSVVASLTGREITSELAISTVKKAIASQPKPNTGLILHSDQGPQYTSEAFTEYCKSVDIAQSMSRAGCPYDNAPMERYFNTLKNELIYHHYYHNDNELNEAVNNFAYVWYNHVRPHTFNGGLTPFEARNKLVNIRLQCYKNA